MNGQIATEVRRTSTGSSGQPPQQPDLPAAEQAKPKKSKHKNSMAMNIALVVGALIFVGACLYLALGTGGDGSDENLSTSAAPAIPEAQEDSAAAPGLITTDETATNDTPTAEDTPAVGAVQEDAADEANTQEPAEAEPEPPAQAAAVEPALAAEPPVPSPPAVPKAPERYSILSQGVLFLRGTVPSEEIEMQIINSVAAILPREGIYSEYTIDPDFVFDPTIAVPVYSADNILFETGSAVIPDEYYPQLAPTPILLQIQPNVVVTVFGHTDSDGSEQGNLELSQARVDAVRDWVIAQGGDPERIIAIGMGESEPIADNSTEEGRAQNRRVEFLLEGFDFSITE